MMRMAERSPRSIASKLSLLDLKRTVEQKRAVCGVGYSKRCKCCIRQKLECECRFDRPSHPNLRKFTKVFLCLEHSEFVWLEDKDKI